jgi:hypothetical protein
MASVVWPDLKEGMYDTPFIGPHEKLAIMTVVAASVSSTVAALAAAEEEASAVREQAG